MTYIWLERDHIVNVIEKEYEKAQRKVLEYIDKNGFVHYGTQFWLGYLKCAENIYKEIKKVKE